MHCRHQILITSQTRMAQRVIGPSCFLLLNGVLGAEIYKLWTPAFAEVKKILAFIRVHLRINISCVVRVLS